MAITNRRPAVLVAAVTLALTACATTAYAVFSTNGKSQISIHNAAEMAGPANSPAVWTLVPNSTLDVNVPAMTQRLANARFTAETRCQGPNFGFCRVKIMSSGPDGVHELHPQSGADFAFDTDVPGAVDVDWYEPGAIERNRRLLQSGPYRFWVEYLVTDAMTIFSLDEWHFTVEVSAL